MRRQYLMSVQLYEKAHMGHVIDKQMPILMTFFILRYLAFPRLLLM